MSTLTEIDMRALAQNGCSAAAIVAIECQGTESERTRVIITRALEALVGNGLIEVKPRDEWPEFFVCDPPYGPPEGDS